MGSPNQSNIEIDEEFLNHRAALQLRGFTQGAQPFLGQWAQRNPLGIPGPLYVADDDSCGTGPGAAPNNVWLHDGNGEFLFRQPESAYELRQIVDAAQINVCSTYAMDGDEHWTPVSVAAWWKSIQPVRHKLRAVISSHGDAVRRYASENKVPGRVNPESGAEYTQLLSTWPDPAARRWLDYLEHGAHTYLRRYMAFLAHGHFPGTDKTGLPELPP